MSVFGQQVAGAQAQSRGTKIKESADFLVELGEIRLQKSNQGLGMVFVVEFTIVEGTYDNPAGAKRSWTQQPDKREQTDPGNIKAFVAVCENMDPDTMTLPPEHYENIVSDNQPYKGKLIKLTTEMITTRSNRPFCVHTWEHYNGPRYEGLPTTSPAPLAPSTPAAPAAPPAPPAPAPELTKEAWLAGQGPGATHPNNAEYEWNPEHPDWGTRKKAG